MNMRNPTMFKKMQSYFIVEVDVVAELIDRPLWWPFPTFERAEWVDLSKLGVTTLRKSALSKYGYMIA